MSFTNGAFFFCSKTNHATATKVDFNQIKKYLHSKLRDKIKKLANTWIIFNNSSSKVLRYE